MSTAYVITPTLEAVEDAILAALAADPVIAAYARDIRGFAGDASQAVTEGSFRDPAFLVLHPGAGAGRRGPLDRVYQARWVVFVRTTNLRSNAAQRNPKAAGEIGAYAMVQDTIRVLQGQTLDLDLMDSFELLESELVATASTTERTRTVFMLTFTCGLQVTPKPAEDALAEILATYEVANPNETTGGTDWLPVTTELVEVPTS